MKKTIGTLFVVFLSYFLFVGATYHVMNKETYDTNTNDIVDNAENCESADFIGPASSTDNAVVRFDGTGGKTGQNSGVIIDDSDNMTGVATLDTGQGANELYDMDQNVLTTSAVTFATVNTGQGANELYDMDQNVLTTSDVTFNDITVSNPSNIYLLSHDSFADFVANEHIDWTTDQSGSSTINTNNIELLEIGTATYDDLQDWINTRQSTGKISGGVITDGGSGNAAVTAGTGFIKTTDSDIGVTKFFDWAANGALGLSDDETNYIYVEYNAGSPQVAASTSMPSDKNTNLLLGLVYRDGTDLHITSAGMWAANYDKKTFFKDMEINGKFQRVSGMLITETGTRNFALTSGAIYAGLTKVSMSAFDSSGADTFTYIYRDGSGGWTEVATQSQIDNVHYDDGDGTLGSVSTSSGWRTYYGVHWVYMDADGDVFVLYGRGNYLLTAAQNAQPPATIPDLLNDIGGIVGKIIIARDASSFESIQSMFGQKINPSVVSNHNELGGLQGGTSDEYYHLTSSEYTELNGWLDDVTLGSSGALTLPTGQNFSIGAVQWNSADEIDGTKIKDADYGDIDVSAGGAWTVSSVQADSVALTTDTTGNYAAGDGEAGNALTGDTATAFFSSGTIEHERGGLEADVSAYDGLIGITGGAIYNQTGTTTQIIIFDGAGAPTSAALSGDATMTNAGVVTISADSVALTTDTTGNYVASVATTSPLSGGAAGSEGATLTLTIADAAADGSTKGAASFTAADFDSSSGNISLDYTNGQKASPTQAGFLTEIATTAETDTGTDAARAVSPDGLAGSKIGTKTVEIICFDYTTDTETGDGKGYIHIPTALNGMNLVTVHAEVISAGTTGTTDIQIYNVTDSVDMLSTKITIDSGETGSDTAATAAVIDTANDDVATNDLLRIDVDAVSTTAADGLIVTLEFRLP